MRFSFFVLLSFLFIFCPVSNLHAQNGGAVALGELRPQHRYQQDTIAVTAFNITNTSLEMETLPRIIRRDLELSGFFKMPSNQMEANRQNLRDNNQQRVDYAAWQNMGVDFYVMGRVEEDGPNYRVRLLLYDINGRQLIINRWFTDRKERYRDLAHLISDEIVKFTKGIDGIARTKLLYVNEQVPGVRELAVMDADGFNARTLTSFGNLVTTPTWGANGAEVYFTSYHGNRGNVYGMNLTYDGVRFHPGQMWTVAAYGGTNHSPTWNQATGRIAMVLSKDGVSEIYSSDRSGQNLRRLTRSRATDGSPAWSPDGRYIAYTSNSSGAVHIHVMNSDGSNNRRLTRIGTWNDAVSWSPDGRRIAFVSRAGGRNDIYVCDASGNNVRRLTQNQGNNTSPSWAPNGTHISFTSDRTGSNQIYLMLDDGSNQRQLTTVGRNTMPDWGPIPQPRQR